MNDDESITSAKLTVMVFTVVILAINSSVGIVSFHETNYSRTYAQSPDSNLKFTGPINLSNNTKDSVYAQISSQGASVYVVWQESDPDSQKQKGSNLYNNNVRNYDILIRKSVDGGLTFGKEINLSNNQGLSEHPQIVVSGDLVHVAWIDNSLTTNRDILYRKSTDGGQTFSKIINLSNSSGADSYNLEIAADGNNFYAVWQDERPQITEMIDSMDGNFNNSGSGNITLNRNNSNVLFRASSDGGNNFRESFTLSNFAFKSYPKIAAFENGVYLVWNVGIISEVVNGTNKDNSRNGIFFTRSVDNGNTFGEPTRLNGEGEPIGESQIASDGNNVYVVWGGNPDEKVVGDLLFARSIDRGKSFSYPVTLEEGNTLNVEVAADRDNNVYVAWQAELEDGNEEILIKKSLDKGLTFPHGYVNISNNLGISECTSISVSEDKTVYVAWEDEILGNHEILLARSIKT